MTRTVITGVTGRMLDRAGKPLTIPVQVAERAEQPGGLRERPANQQGDTEQQPQPRRPHRVHQPGRGMRARERERRSERAEHERQPGAADPHFTGAQALIAFDAAERNVCIVTRPPELRSLARAKWGYPPPPTGAIVENSPPPAGSQTSSRP